MLRLTSSVSNVCAVLATSAAVLATSRIGVDDKRRTPFLPASPSDISGSESSLSRVAAESATSAAVLAKMGVLVPERGADRFLISVTALGTGLTVPDRVLEVSEDPVPRGTSITLYRFPASSVSMGASSSSTQTFPLPNRNLYWTLEPASANTSALYSRSPFSSTVFSISFGCHSDPEKGPATNTGDSAPEWR